MLKIKDNVDLNILINYGFVKNDFYYDFVVDAERDNANSWLYVFKGDRHIYSEPDFCLGDYEQEVIFDKLFELFNAGLVEKV